MDTFINAAGSVLPLFIVIIIGLVITRLKIADKSWVDILNKYALWIGFPALVIYSLLNLDLSGTSYAQLIVANSIYIIACILLAYPVSKIAGFGNQMRRTLFLSLGFGNVAYLGIPVLQNLFGHEILPVAAIISAVYVFWLFTLSIILVEVHGPKNTNFVGLLSNLIKNPLLISVFIGVIIAVFQIKIPAPIEKTIKLFSDSVTAVVLLSLGIFLGLQDIGKLHEWKLVFLFAIITMILLPAIFLISLKCFVPGFLYLQPSVVDAAMPLGLTPYVLAVKYKLEVKFTARMVVLATMLSMVIIPLWMVILN